MLVIPSTYFIFRIYPKELLHVFEGSETIYRKAHLITAWTATRFILTRNLTNPLAAGAIEELLIITGELNSNDGQHVREGPYSQERGDCHHTGTRA